MSINANRLVVEPLKLYSPLSSAWLLCFAMLMFLASNVVAQDGELSKSTLKSSIDRGANWLIDNQRADGSWGSMAGDPGITGMVIKALADTPRAYREKDGPFITSAIKSLLDQQQEDGGVYVPGQGLMNYKTSIAILALTALDQGRPEPMYTDAVAKMRDYVSGLQCAENSSPIPYDRMAHTGSYGGIGYGSDRRPDLSNTQLAMEALQAAGLAEDSDVWKRAAVFVSRCQNRKSSNDVLDGVKKSSSEDGGFFYHPDESKAGKKTDAAGAVTFSSYGSMTYAAVKSLIYAGLEKDDPRVKAAVDWMGNHWTVTENPGMATPEQPARGQTGYYYYLAVMARALEVLGQKELVDASGVSHDWAREIAAELVKRQSKDGSWMNPVDRWWEGDPILATAYALQALNICYANMEE
ncbi:MAG: hypothetical protein CBC13_10155 [Planctomycetia bacterium TMED53]|nr:MAG: hypothetical protein CBC13_10155 [Planctomycetia bacterium TMED53]